MSYNSVIVCHTLGLKTDFFGCLRSTLSGKRNHLTLQELICRIFKSNYEGLNLTGKNIATGEMLCAIGFDSSSSVIQKILKRIKNAICMQEHLDTSEWAIRFILDEFKYNRLFVDSVDRFPFEKKANELVLLTKEELNTYDDRPCHISIANVVPETKDAELTTILLSGKYEEDGYRLLFHGTDHKSAVDILDGRGIHLYAGRRDRDFSSGRGFYLSGDYRHALHWAKSTTVKPALLIYKIEDDFLTQFKKLSLGKNHSDWINIVTLFREDRPSDKQKQILSDYDVIEGPLALVSTICGKKRYTAAPETYQLCLISTLAADLFESKLHCILFY